MVDSCECLLASRNRKVLGVWAFGYCRGLLSLKTFGGRGFAMVLYEAYNIL